MVDVVKEHKKLKSFSVHGVRFHSSSGNEAVGTCPFCGKQKFYANHRNRAWDCKVCGKQGGLNTFLAEMMTEVYIKQANRKVLGRLARNRGIRRKTLMAYNVGFDGIKTYMIPIVIDGKTVDIRRYELDGKLRSTAGAHGPVLIKHGKSRRLWLCEGEWDGMVVWEALQSRELDDTVVAVTGALQFPSRMAPIAQGKTVYMVFDYDETGDKGDAKTRRFLDGYARKVLSIHWPKGTELEWDVRDQYHALDKSGSKLITFLKKHSTEEERLIIAVDNDGPSMGGGMSTIEDLDGEGLPHKHVIKSYRKWLDLPSIEPIDVMYGSVFANRLSGDPLWMFLVGPPGCGKTEQLMTLNEAPLITTTTSVTSASLISGANFFGGGDPSLIPRLDSRVLVIKDFTTILTTHQQERDQIFGILRDAYDGQVEKFFGTGVHRRYESRFGIIAGVTPVIEEYSSMASVLGERFVKYRFPARSAESEKNIIRKALRNIAKEPALRAHLMEVSSETLNRPCDPEKPPAIDDDTIEILIGLSLWIARLRGVVSREKFTGQVLYRPVPEMGTRLAKQLTKLAMGIAMFHHRDYLELSDLRASIQVARDSAPDMVEIIVQQLFIRSKENFATTKDIASWTHVPEATVLKFLRDLYLLRVVQMHKGARMSTSWRLSKLIKSMMEPLNIYDKEERWLAGGKANLVDEESVWRADLRKRGAKERVRSEKVLKRRMQKTITQRKRRKVNKRRIK